MKTSVIVERNSNILVHHESNGEYVLVSDTPEMEKLEFPYESESDAYKAARKFIEMVGYLCKDTREVELPTSTHPNIPIYEAGMTSEYDGDKSCKKVEVRISWRIYIS